LHERYAPYSASPAHALGFLRRLVSPDDKSQLTKAAVDEAFGRESGLPKLLLDDRVPMHREETRSWFAERVMGQGRAVDQVVSTIASVKAGMSRPGRPIATMIFIGPTGVGKTEMAKSLSAFLFGSPDRLLRFDMSEYADPMAAERLIGGSQGGEGLLTSAIRETPFSIVLLDEFEKAHPRLFDLFLQVFDDGRLTDSVGRVADFCSSVIIMTSNLGVDSFGKQSAALTGDSFSDSDTHFTRALQNFLRPEMVNRIDRIVPFDALSPAVVTRIAAQTIAESANRDGLRLRRAHLEVAAGLDGEIAEIAYDPRYGARPVRRTVTKELLAPLAVQLNRYQSSSALDVSVGLGMAVSVSAQKGRNGEVVDALTGSEAERKLVNILTRLRRDANCLARHDYVCELRNEVTERLHRQDRKRKRGKKVPHDPRLQALQDVLEDVAAIEARSNAMEAVALRAVYGHRPLEEPDHDGLREELTELVLLILALCSGDQREIHLAFRCNSGFGWRLAAAYVDACAELGAPCYALHWIRMSEAQFKEWTAYKEEHPDETQISERAVTALDGQLIRVISPPYLLCASGSLGSVPDGALEIVLRFSGRGHLLLRGEDGFHACVGGKEDAQVRVVAEDGRPQVPNARLSGRPRRIYDVAKKEVYDQESNRRLRWNGKDLKGPLHVLLAASLAQNISDMLWQEPDLASAIAKLGL
jgi:ATP-dependent Clp protease ATP-binding subunit ClpC